MIAKGKACSISSLACFFRSRQLTPCPLYLVRYLLSLSSSLLVHHLNERLDVAKAVRKGLAPVLVAVDLGNVVGHQHSVVADLPIGSDRTKEIDVAVAGKGLLEIQETAFDITEVD